VIYKIFTAKGLLSVFLPLLLLAPKSQGQLLYQVRTTVFFICVYWTVFVVGTLFDGYFNIIAKEMKNYLQGS